MNVEVNRQTFLVVEDELPLQEAVKKKCHTKGIHVIGVSSVADAIVALKQHTNISAIWLDHYLVGSEDGLVLAKKVKEHGSPWESIPIFIVSNTASAEKVEEYLHVGVEEYFVKASNRLGDILEDILNFLSFEKAAA